MNDTLNPYDCPRCGQHESYGCSCTRIEQLEARLSDSTDNLVTVTKKLAKAEAQLANKPKGVTQNSFNTLQANFLAVSKELAKVQALVDALEKIKLRDGRGSDYIICHECGDSSNDAEAALEQFNLVRK